MPTLNLVALPIVAGLMAGTGAVAAYVTGPTTPPVAVTAPAAAAVLPAEDAKPADQPCAAQTWPYLDARCLTRAPDRRVRVVTAPQADDTDGTAASPAPAQQAAVSPPDQLTPRSGLTSSDAVLHQGGVVPAQGKARRKRANERSRYVARSYRVPSERHGGSGALIVVRPLRLDAFR